jgi:cytoskeletal protein RodZ
MKFSPIIAILSIVLIAFSGCTAVPSVNTATPYEQQSISVSAGEKETDSAMETTAPTEKTQPTAETEKITEPTSASSFEEKTETNPTKPEGSQEQSTHQNNTEPITKEPEQKTTSKADTKPAEKETQKPELETQAPKADKDAAIQSGISYGKSLGMELDSSLTISNSSWFSPTDISYFPTTSELTGLCCEKIDYLLSFWGEQGYKPTDFCFNLIISNGDLYLLYA